MRIQFMHVDWMDINLGCIIWLDQYWQMALTQFRRAMLELRYALTYIVSCIHTNSVTGFDENELCSIECYIVAWLLKK